MEGVFFLEKKEKKESWTSGSLYFVFKTICTNSTSKILSIDLVLELYNKIEDTIFIYLFFF